MKAIQSMPKAPNNEGTLLCLAVAPLVWPVHRTHILSQPVIGDLEITIRLEPSRQMDISLGYRNGPRTAVQSCPLIFDNAGDPARKYYLLAISWKGVDVGVAAGGSMIAGNSPETAIPTEKVIALKTEQEASLAEKATTASGAVVRGEGCVGPVPIEFAGVKDEVERAARCLKILETASQLPELSDAWKAFLDAFGKVRFKMIAGTRLLASSEQEGKSWIGLYEARCKASKLLSYLHHARNADTHGLAAIISPEDAQLHLSSSGTTIIKSLLATKSGVRVEFTGFPPTVHVSPSQVFALSVTDSGVTYDPPAKDIGLYQLAQSGLIFLEEWLEDGARKFG